MSDTKDAFDIKDGDMAQMFGITFFSRRSDRLLSALNRVLESKHDKCLIFTPNPEIIVESKTNEKLATALKKADVNIPDGIGVVWASKIYRLLGKVDVAIEERIAGADLAEMLVKDCASRDLPVLLLGAGDGVAEAAARNLMRKYSGLKVEALMGYENASQPTREEEAQVTVIINKVKPALLLVAFGQVKQEVWLNGHRDLSFKIGMGVGGTLDFWAGKRRRAPQLLRQVGLEWLWRLLQEPWRWKRQLRLVSFLKLFFEGVGVDAQ